jgi:hypothetical protein
MDFKTLSKFVIILGILILGYGIIRFGITMLPHKRTLNDQWGRVLEDWDRAQINESKRASATKVIIAGAIVLFFGVGMSLSVKKPKALVEEDAKFDPNDPVAQKYQAMTNAELKEILAAPPGFHSVQAVRIARKILASRSDKTHGDIAPS